MRCDWQEVGNRINGLGDVYCARKGCGRRIRNTLAKPDEIQGDDSCLCGDCQHKGEQLRQQDCPTCCGSRIKVFACDVHEECTLGTELPNIKRCPCNDYLPPDISQ